MGSGISSGGSTSAKGVVDWAGGSNGPGKGVHILRDLIKNCGCRLFVRTRQICFVLHAKKNPIHQKHHCDWLAAKIQLVCPQMAFSVCLSNHVNNYNFPRPCMGTEMLLPAVNVQVHACISEFTFRLCGEWEADRKLFFLPYRLPTPCMAVHLLIPVSQLLVVEEKWKGLYAF